MKPNAAASVQRACFGSGSLTLSITNTGMTLAAAQLEPGLLLQGVEQRDILGLYSGGMFCKSRSASLAHPAAR
jgi:hypothetical protein